MVNFVNFNEVWSNLHKTMHKVLNILVVLFFLWNAPQTISQTISYYATGEEFSGPLPSWKNIKTDFGAKGDGITDDAPAITAALYAFRDMDNIDYSVLYFPAGTYRLGSTIFNADRAGGGTHYAGLGIVGEDPSNTILLWDGSDEGTMFRLDGWYMKVSRLTFDGQNKAKTGLLRDGGFGTGVEYSDLVFKDLIWGVLMGGDSGSGQAENLFLRCRFLNCECGIYGPNMNSLDTWLWYCLFQDCHFGVHCGGYQAYGNVFLRSKVVDIGLSWQPVCLVNNISINSELFNKYSQSAVLFQGNEIYNPDTTVYNDHEYLVDTIKAFSAPYTSVLLDNIIKTSGDAGAAIELSDGKCISVGNTFTQLWPVRPKYQRFTRAPYNYVQQAVDGNTETYYTGGLCENIAGITWYSPSGTERVVVKYSITATAKDVREWDLKSFRLVGSNDWGYHITVLDSQLNQSWSYGETKAFTIGNLTPFAMYRLEVMENNNGDKPGYCGWFEVAEFSLTDTAGVNVIGEPGGFIAGAEEIWGKYYSLHEKVVPYSSIPNPDVIQLPGTPPLVNRRIFEVRKGTTDDAGEIQMKIDSAATMLPGTRPIVHIPKGTYNIKTTIFLPANVDMTLSGDGIYNGGTLLDRDSGLSGPTLRILAPSHLLMRDIEVRGNEAIYAEVDDQSGSRVTGALLFFGGIPWWIDMANTAMIIDGIEQSNMLFSCVNMGCCYNGVLVKGGPVLSSGGSTCGQIAFLGGGHSLGQNMWETQKNGRLITQGMWYECDFDYTKSLINLTEESSGSLAIAGMFWYYNPDPDRPIVSIDNFSGQFTAVTNTFSRWDRPNTWKLKGNGAQARILSACNDWYLETDSVVLVNQYPFWIDQTSPSAIASQMFCVGPEITNKIMNTLPDSSSLLSSLELMRSLRIEKPTPPRNEDSHLDFIRVSAFCPTGGTAVRFIAVPDPYGRPESPTLISPLNKATDITTNPTMNWNASTGASTYRLQVSSSVSFNSIVFEDSTISATNQEIGSLMNNTVYYWRVLAKNSNGNSMWSPVWSYTTGTGTSIEQINTEIPSEFYLGNNFPNPFCMNTSIVYSIPLNEKVNLLLFNTWGREIATLVNEEQIAGKYEVKVDGSKLPEGIYFYRMQAGPYSETRKMVLIK
jgi:hypothetical protein